MDWLQERFKVSTFLDGHNIVTPFQDNPKLCCWWYMPTTLTWKCQGFLDICSRFVGYMPIRLCLKSLIRRMPIYAPVYPRCRCFIWKIKVVIAHRNQDISHDVPSMNIQYHTCPSFLGLNPPILVILRPESMIQKPQWIDMSMSITWSQIENYCSITRTPLWLHFHPP